MKATILIDNKPSSCNNTLGCEHGFAAHVSIDGVNILVDTGVSGIFASNAKHLGINLKDLDFTVISHAHKDHSGGIETLLQYSTAPIYISEEVSEHKYYSSRHEQKRDISPTIDFNSYDQFRFIDQSFWIRENVAMVKCSCKAYSTPLGNKYLTIDNEIADNFTHEYSVAVKTPKGLVIVSPCSHCGAANIIKSAMDFCCEDRVIGFIGGLHFVEGCEPLWEDLRAINFSGEIHTGHCTCDLAKSELSASGNSIKFFETGATISF